MNSIQIENIPQTWDDARDVSFFTIATRLFSTEFLYGAGVLLATYDDGQPTPTESVATDASESTQIALVSATHITALEN